MKTSESGKTLIKKYEGLRLKSYKCAAGVWTIGYGHTQGVTQGMTITQSQAEEYLSSDILKFENIVNQYDLYYNFNQNEFDALVSFTFNCGAANLKNLTKTKTRTKEQISQHITAYNKAAGVILSGLLRRRNEEKKLFLTPVVADQKEIYYPKYNGCSGAIDSVFEEIGATVDYDYLAKKKYLQRLPIALANGITEYKGTAVQNQELINLARQGILRRV